MSIALEQSAGAAGTKPANPVRAEADWPPVVVAGAFQTGVVLMRDLLRRGLRVCAFDCEPTHAGFSSVYGKSYLCPDPDTQPEAWVGFMINLAREIGGKPVLIPSADQFVSAISEHAEQLAPYFTFLRAASATQALLATKQRQYDMAASHGLPTARTRFVRTPEELEEFASSAHFPCLLKPLHCREWERLPAGHPCQGEKLALAASPEKLTEHYRGIAAYTPEVVVQEVIEGPDTAKLCYLSCYSRTGRLLGSCLVRQLRTDPIYFGSASVVEPVSDPEAHALSDAFLREIQYAGLCELELKRDSRDGKLKLIEANPRYSVTSDAAPPAGVDLGWLHYLDLIGFEVQPVRQNSFQYRHIVLRRDFKTFRSYLKAGLLSWGEFFRSYRRPVYFFDFDWRDRRISWTTLVDLTKVLLHPYMRRVIPKRSG
jgi:predicted ATP-grasp superfamily ATP-dependent carboligase